MPVNQQQSKSNSTQYINIFDFDYTVTKEHSFGKTRVSNEMNEHPQDWFQTGRQQAQALM